MLTNEGYENIIRLESLRAVRVFLKLMQLSSGYGSVTITQVELAEMLNLKNKANISIAINELIEKEFISKSSNKKQITYYINPNFYVTQKGYNVLQQQFIKSKEDLKFNELLKACIET